jgi:predicted amidohydrolase
VSAVRGSLRATALLLVIACQPIPDGASAADYRGGGSIHVAAIQLEPIKNDLEANQAEIERLVREAAKRGATYILLPEGYPGQLPTGDGTTAEEKQRAAQPIDGPLVKAMLDLCKELDVYIGFGLAERRDGNVYNSTIYAGPDGVQGVYSKVALTRNAKPAKGTKPRPSERDVFTRGTTDGVIEWGGVRIGALICADGGFPNLYTNRVNEGVQLFAHPSGSTGRKGTKNNPSPCEAARRYGRPVIFANAYFRTLLHQGNSQICDAQGNLVARVGPTANVVIEGQVTLPPVAEAD